MWLNRRRSRGLKGRHEDVVDECLRFHLRELRREGITSVASGPMAPMRADFPRGRVAMGQAPAPEPRQPGEDRRAHDGCDAEGPRTFDGGLQHLRVREVDAVKTPSAVTDGLRSGGACRPRGSAGSVFRASRFRRDLTPRRARRRPAVHPTVTDWASGRRHRLPVDELRHIRRVEPNGRQRLER